MGFALTPGEAPLHFSRSKNVMHVVDGMNWTTCLEYGGDGDDIEVARFGCPHTVDGRPHER